MYSYHKIIIIVIIKTIIIRLATGNWEVIDLFIAFMVVMVLQLNT